LNHSAAKPQIRPTEDRLVEKGLLAIRSRREGAMHLIEVSGELDLHTASLLSDELERAEAGDAEQILLDLSGLEFIESTGLEVLVTTATRLDDSKRLQMLPGTGQVERVLRLTELSDHLPFVASDSR
jgi:anti-sigma B factor antagonist